MTRWVHGISDGLLREVFKEYFGVGDEHADVLIVLFGRPGEWTPMKRLQILLDSHRPPKRQAVYERISVLRDAMEPESLLSGGQLDEYAQGFALSETGFAECTKAIHAIVRALLMAGPRIVVTEGDDKSPISNLGMDELRTAIRQLDVSRPESFTLPTVSAPLRTPLKKAS